MSKKFFGLSSSARNPTSPIQEKTQADSVSALYELGLLGSGDGRSKRREKGQNRDLLGGPEVEESFPRKSTHLPPSPFSYLTATIPPTVFSSVWYPSCRKGVDLQI